VGFVLFEFWLTDLSEQRAQRELRADFQTALLTASSGGETEDPGDAFGEFGDFGEFGEPLGEESADAEVEVVDYEAPARGSAVAVLDVPAIDLHKVVVAGTGANELKTGPGHYRTSPLPGQPGNAVIIGHRTTYGEPFRHLDDLEPADKILVTTTQGIFEYRVVDTTVIEPGDPDVFEQGGENTLTLVTGEPEFSARNRLVVTAELSGDAVLPPEDALEARRKGFSPTLTPDETGNRADTAAWVWVVLWGELLIVAVLVARRLYRRWHRWPTWLLTTPVILALAFLFYESVDRLLPSKL